MKVKLESRRLSGTLFYQSRIKSGYLLGDLLTVAGHPDTPIRVTDRDAFIKWLHEVGYEVLNPEFEGE